MKCPEYGCDNKPTEKEVHSIINENCFQKFIKFRLNTQVAQDKDLMFCTTPNCEMVLNKKKAKKNKIVCE